MSEPEPWRNRGSRPEIGSKRLCFKGVVDFFERLAERVFQKNQQHL
jgi:hypothetical protein